MSKQNNQKKIFDRALKRIEKKADGHNKTIIPWVCNKCSWHNSHIDEKCRNKTCNNTKNKNSDKK